MTFSKRASLNVSVVIRFRYKREKDVVEKDLSLLKQELEVIKKEASAPRSPTRLVGLVKMICNTCRLVQMICQ